MSKIAISGASTGTATFTIESPATSTNRTLTLPDNTGTIITQNSTPAFASTIGVGGATAAASGAGITFPATASASSDANTLDDYEEGDFTPTVIYSGTNTPTYVTQQGRYTKIGRVVQIQLALSWNENGSTGNITLGGLPFVALNRIDRAVSSIFSFGLTGLPTNVSISGFVTLNAQTITLFLNDNAATPFSATYTDNDQDMYATVVYEVA